MIADRPMLEDSIICKVVLNAAFALKGGKELENNCICSMIFRGWQYDTSGATHMRIHNILLLEYFRGESSQVMAIL